MPSEISRILALPRRHSLPEDTVRRLTAALKTPRGTMVLWEMQACVLLSAVQQRRISPELGVFVRAGVGSGKTLPGLLLPTVIPPPAPGRRAVYLCPAALRDKTMWEMPEYRKHWKIRSDILVHSYEEVSCDPDLLDKIKAYLVICDEGQAIKNMASARTRRVLRTARLDPSIVWVIMSATSSTKGLKDHAHLFELSLRSGSPIPTHKTELEAWARCVDSVVTAEASDWGMIRPLADAWSPPDILPTDVWDKSAGSRIECCRRSLDARIAATPGVVTGSRVDVDAKLTLRSVRFECPPEIEEALGELDRTGELPGSGGVSIVRDKKMEAAGRGVQNIAQSQICMGFYYRWAWEKTAHGEPDIDYLERRRSWSKASAEYLIAGGQGERDGIDTPGQIVRELGLVPSFVQHAWGDWEPARDRYRVCYPGQKPSSIGEPIPVEPVWLTTAIIDKMAERLRRKCILWYKHRVIALELRRRGLRVVMSGERIPWDELTGDGRPVALSEFSHCEGLNLQAWRRMVITSPGAAKNSPGAQLEQVIGRVYRSGQMADEVVADFWQHAEPLRENLTVAIQQAKYIQGTSQIPQRLLLGTWKEVTK